MSVAPTSAPTPLSPRLHPAPRSLRVLAPLLAAAAAVALAGCWGGDNGGDAFGFPGGGGGGGGIGTVDPAAPTEGTQSLRGAPKIVDVQPAGNQPVDVGTPVIVTFSESMQTGRITSANLIVRPEGATSGVGGTFVVRVRGVEREPEQVA